MGMSIIAVGDYVIPAFDPEKDAEFEHVWERMWTPCKVLNVYKNGNLRARSDDGRTKWRGPVSGFQHADQNPK
ncbi:hypothetical protein SEA_LIZZIANA_48 [Mycobacterium phage Lizziana]|nr:hypothetical protein PBI_CHE9D_49 [Mycobacterium phage Che9d]YP_009959208.1 hypothetical protein I5H58_gp048 [Mycobacterium phage Lizziana]AAN07967.1 hypothetical protein PBI_CHE9D_49 [Mycobacterium phage Che9d]AYN58351.1 hypothetical protein SEA_LIZZIANA_48 [Mycobacterium phage Lizziana]